MILFTFREAMDALIAEIRALAEALIKTAGDGVSATASTAPFLAAFAVLSDAALCSSSTAAERQTFFRKHYIPLAEYVVQRLWPAWPQDNSTAAEQLDQLFASPPVPPTLVLFALCSAMRGSTAAQHTQHLAALLSPVFSNSNSSSSSQQALLTQAFTEAAVWCSGAQAPLSAQLLAVAVQGLPRLVANALGPLTPTPLLPRPYFAAVSAALLTAAVNSELSQFSPVWQAMVSRLVVGGETAALARAWCDAAIDRTLQQQQVLMHQKLFAASLTTAKAFSCCRFPSVQACIQQIADAMIILLSSRAHAQQAAAVQHTQLMLALPVETVERLTEALLLELSNGSSTAASSNGKESNCKNSNSNSSNSELSDAAKQQSEAAATLLFSGALSSTAASSGAVVGVLKHALAR
eukprot:8090-Heterococcus_DN1.PRE.3